MIRIVVCDTGPLLHLSEAGAIHLLQNAGQILIPESVTKELNKTHRDGIHRNGLKFINWIRQPKNAQPNLLNLILLIWEKQRLLRWQSKSKRTGLSP